MLLAHISINITSGGTCKLVIQEGHNSIHVEYIMADEAPSNSIINQCGFMTSKTHIGRKRSNVDYCMN